MYISKPNYYDAFRCLADQCEDTCCAGWQIVIDEDSLEAYKKVEGDFGKTLRDSIDWKEGVFHQDSLGRCAFLNEKNLCNLYTALGEESLCVTCTNYPRHIEEFENIREYTLSLSCPEVARILLEQKEPVHFLEEEVEGEEEFEDFDFLLFSQLEETRDVMEKILQDRSRDIFLRGALVWSLGVKMQQYMDEERLFDLPELYAEYDHIKNWDDWNMAKQKLDLSDEKENVLLLSQEARDGAPVPAMEFTQKYFYKLYELEPLKDEWQVELGETEAILFHSEKLYEEIHEKFQKWLEKNMPDYTIWLEQLMVYFIHTYFCGAVYNYYVAAKAKLAVFSTWMLYEMMAAKWYWQGETLEKEEVISLIYRYSRELEHSDLNLAAMDELLDE